jgi:hypothetical protein
MNRLEADLEIALLKLHQRWKTELGYNAKFFRQMFIRTKSKRYKGPLGTVRHVLHAYKKTAGLSRLDDNSLFLKRNFFLRRPSPCSPRNRSSAVWNRSSYRAAGRCSLA